MEELKQNVMGIKAGGGTNMESAYQAATACYKQLFESVSKLDTTDDGSTPKDTDTAPAAAKANDEGGDNDKAEAKDDKDKDTKERESWTANSKCEVFSESDNKWYEATIIKVTNDEEGEWINVTYKSGDGQETPTLKQIGRYAKEIRPIEAGFQPNQEFANRIIFLTDAQPNSYSGGDSLLNQVQRNSSTDQYKGFQIHTTFIGVGLDFNTKFVEDIIKVEGGNYYAVHSNEEFMKTMDEEFKFMVTPLVFNFVLTLMAEGNSCCIEEAFGSGDDEKAIVDNGEVMNVKSMFPSQHDENDQVKGGVVVLKLKNDVNGKKDASYNMEIKSTYKDIDGKDYVLENNVMFGGGEENLNLKKDEEYYDNGGIRKSLLLVRYVQLLKLWMNYQKKQSDKTKVTEEYKDIIRQFIDYFKSEMEVIGDKTMDKELKILNQLVKDKKADK
eukprot:CAMPEP_0201575422 /NCGR_PEP_ID=MMETSP0190_2-20130828/20624_1 /ASSEMBLY_ACC=CAM_ASM_000263 /TAXON_ID=37353 /ORGANISM="Rosalina sp." /LENGTH=441 /DNA_ID=CAMNT_0048005049 /DNA_START=584 /DNA_END=1909 /DNA_ORIENTATION=+